MLVLPSFTEDGLLPPGDYAMSLDALARSPLVAGPPDGMPWDAGWRATLVHNLGVLVSHLAAAGVQDVFVDGSFVEAKPHPNDVDGYFLCAAGDLYDGTLEARLHALDPVWTWDFDSRYRPAGGGKAQLPMWHKYRVELFPHVGQKVGIFDPFGNELEFPAAFRQSRSFKPKGIVKLITGGKR